MEMSTPRPHFLLLAFPLQGYIAPALRLAKRLLAAAPDALVTFSTTAAAHSRMFSSSGEDNCSDGDGRLEFLPFSDDEVAAKPGRGAVVDAAACSAYMASFHAASARCAGALMDALRSRGRPVTRVVYTLMLPWPARVARARGVPSTLYWPQPAAVFAAYHHYFLSGYAGVVDEHRHDPSYVVHLPGLPPQRVGDLPSFITESTDPSHLFHGVFTTLRDHFDVLRDREEEATVLVNSSRELEPGALAAVGAARNLLLLPVGPVVASHDEAGLFRAEYGSKHMEWLNTKPARSVVYVAIGSFVLMAREQLAELLRGLEDTGRPYLLVVRKDNKQQAAADYGVLDLLKNGIVVEWCDQVRVLAHAAVGCFVTHCGWNSVMESVASGVPIVGMPHFSDQRTNARLVERQWRVGVRALADNGSSGLVRAAELRRCIQEVMGDGEAAAKLRRNAREWKRVVAQATAKGGSSDSSLMEFVRGAAGTC